MRGILRMNVNVPKLTYDDIALVPKFSFIDSRADVDTSIQLSANLRLKLPVISSNMKTVTGPKLAKAMREYGAIGALHRFDTVGKAISDFYEADQDCFVSVGITPGEFDRYKALRLAGATNICVDVAHAANINVVEFVNRIKIWEQNYSKERYQTISVRDITLMVGNFGSVESLSQFAELTGDYVDLYKILIAPGANCETGIKTGVYTPSVSTILDCVKAGFPVVADGGIKNPGDVCKALALGCKAVMIGSMFAGSEEANSDIIFGTLNLYTMSTDPMPHKEHRGSSCGRLGEKNRTSEGVITRVPFTGPIENTLKDIEGGLRSCMSYLNARNIEELVENAEFIILSPSSHREQGTRNEVIGR